MPIHNLNLKSKVIAIDSNPDLSPACYVADKFYKVPNLNQDSFSEKLMSICQEECIGIIVPTIDTELPFYARVKDKFKLKGITVIVSNPSVIPPE